MTATHQHGERVSDDDRARLGRRARLLAGASVAYQTLLCTYMSAVLLGGLVLNAALGWWWADPVAGLVIAGIALNEGREAWRGEGCCAPSSPVSASCNDGCC